MRNYYPLPELKGTEAVLSLGYKIKIVLCNKTYHDASLWAV